MRIEITERHCQVESDTRARAEKAVASLAKYSPRATLAEVIFTEESPGRVVELIVHVDGAENLVASAEATDFRAALDKVVDRMARRLRRQRKRLTDHKAPSRARASRGGGRPA